MAKHGKLELTWVGKDERVKLEPRVLVEDPTKSYRDPNSENMLIYGDNLLGLKAIEQDFAGKIKCIYIDPPFNTGQAFEHYDDGIEHSLWLSMMRDRLELLRILLSPEGTLFVHLNVDELAYFKVMSDEVFGRHNFLQLITIKAASTASFRAINTCPVTVTEYILQYARNRAVYQRPMQYVRTEYTEDYGHYIRNRSDDSSKWEIVSLADMVHEKFGFTSWQDAKKAWGIHWKEIRRAEMASIAIAEPTAVVSLNTMQKPSQAIQDIIEKSKSNKNQVHRMDRELHDPIYVYNGRTLAFFVKKLRLIDGTLVPTDVLTNFWGDISYLSLGLEGGVDFKNGKKPEAIIKRVLEIATDSGDWVLDSFAGSGTTGAVAHKMGRKWIMCELGEHCHTHIIPRMKQVIDGTDLGGISKAVNWQGGGGFKYYRLAESLLVTDKELSTKNHPVYIINPRYDEKMLIQAICKIENFRYRNEGRLHGVSSESRFLHVTTNLLTQVYLDSLAEDIGKDQSLLIYCTRRKRSLDVPNNIEIKKIPRDLLRKCYFQEDVK